ncbi:TPM domain-containing protein [Leptospira idonii]|uniref:TPM domain-containing protein n=1 Tax=Leptospira idonii TaxID=1193500 RepID=A0A4R9LZ84_9LEPT|nr:TPM domain-containing protein [Leptospira idonii]TGN19670.1 hypothetical protein EHS15_07785 [Leptospira idonii]
MKSLAFLLFCFVSWQSTFAREVPPLTRRVTAEPGLLSFMFADKMEALLEKHEKETTNQIAILAIYSLEGENLEEYSIKVVEEWKLGQKKHDNGILILLAVTERKARIEVGYGLEWMLTDVYCNRILNQVMIPEFKKENYEAGLEKGVLALMEVLEGGEPPKEQSIWEKFVSFHGVGAEEGEYWLYLFGLPFVAIIFIFAFIGAFHRDSSSWFMFFFLLIFFQWVPSMFYGFWGWLLSNLVYLIGFPFVRWGRDKISWLRKISDKVTDNVSYSEGSGGTSDGGGFSSGGSSSGGGFSGGGGSFGGGGSSGSW